MMIRNFIVRRYVIALLVSLLLHLLWLLLLENVGTGGAGGSRYLNVELAGQAVNLTHEGTFSTQRALQGESGQTESGGPQSRYYYAAHEVDKRAEFLFEAPVLGLAEVQGNLVRSKFRVKVLVNELGEVDGVTILELKPSDRYKRNILDALWKSRFSPAEKNGKRVKSRKILEAEFDAIY